MESFQIITAAQAKEKAEEVNKAAELTEKHRVTEQVMDLISSASAKGKFKARLPYYMTNINNVVISEYHWLADLLNEAGYSIYPDSEENNDMTIWWA